MQYEVLPIRAKEPHEVAESIAAAYEDVARRLGEVVAGYALTCESRPDHQDSPAGSGSNYLFIVAVFPDQGPSSRRQVAIRREGGKASKWRTD